MREEAQPARLVVAISSRALFDLEDSHNLFEREGLAAYAAFPAPARRRSRCSRGLPSRWCKNCWP
jgi:hypothetical protein